MITFTPALLEPWQIEIANLYEQLAIDIAAIHENQSRLLNQVAFFNCAKELNNDRT